MDAPTAKSFNYGDWWKPVERPPVEEVRYYFKRIL